MPGSHSGLSVKNNKNMKNVKDCSMKQYAITQHKAVRLNFERRKTIVGGIDHQWQCDLCDMQNISADNDRYKFLLANVNVFFEICDYCSAEKQKCSRC